MRVQNPELLAEAVIYRFYNEAITTGEHLTRDDIQASFKKTPITSTLLKFALVSLGQRKFIEEHRGYRGSISFEITRAGYDYVKYRLSLPDSAICKFSSREAWLVEQEQPGDDAPVVAEVPASDRVVSLDHNSAAYKEAIAALDQVTEAARASNELGAEDPLEKERVIAELSAAKRLLESIKVSVQKVSALIGTTLLWLGSKFAEAPIGEAAMYAWNLIKPLIGL